MIHHTELGFKLGGELNLGERIGVAPPFDTIKLIDGEDEDGEIGFHLGYSTDSEITEREGFAIDLSAHHWLNPETGRVFHAVLRVFPSREHVKQLRDFCDLLLAMTGSEK